MSVRTSRTRLITAAATVALAALSLTACGDNDASDTAIAPPAASGPTATVPASPAAPAPSAGGTGTTTGTTAGATGGAPVGKPAPTASKPAAKAPSQGAPAPKTPADSGKPVTCEGSNTKTTAALLNRPINHMLLTVTNTGSGRCYLYRYPAVRFGEAQSVPPAMDETIPQAVVTLEPGESGYAAVVLAAGDGSGGNGRTENSLAVYFNGPSGNESVGSGAHPSLPAKGAYVDDSLKVTYWQTSMDAALGW